MTATASADWLADEIESLTDRIERIAPSEWAETNRKLPPSVTSKPGMYQYKFMPYLRQIVDCMDVRSPVRKIVIMKGAQTGGTVGVLENALGYYISHIRTAPMIFVTATKVLAALRLDKYIMPMIAHSKLSGNIQNNSDNKRKAGATASQLSFFGGGFMVLTSAESPADLRSVSARIAYCDEVDGWPINVGNDGCPLALTMTRMKGFEDSCKALLISTPLIKETSRIKREYEAGDRRIYEVPCLGCGDFQELRWTHKDTTGKKTGGIVWESHKDGRVVPGSVRYKCRGCGHLHKNAHKSKMMPLGAWRATAIPIHPSVRSYHITGLMSPPGFYSWESAVVDWMKAWNVVTNEVRNRQLLQEFYNNVLGEPFRTGGSKLTIAMIARHVRNYKFGQVPNAFAQTMAGGKVAYLTCSADVQKDWIAACVYAHAPGRISYLVGRYRFDGDTSSPFDNMGPWGKLDELIFQKFHDGVDREYSCMATMIDSGYRTAEVYAFCGRYKFGVYPIRGDDRASSGGGKEFARIKEASVSGLDGWRINVTHYKNRINSVLKAAPFPTSEPAAVDTVSFPFDLENDALNEMIAEEFCEVEDKNGKKRWMWRRVHARNELWDLTVYALAGRDIVAYMLCREHFELDEIVWGDLWPLLEASQYGFAETPPIEQEHDPMA